MNYKKERSKFTPVNTLFHQAMHQLKRCNQFSMHAAIRCMEYKVFLSYMLIYIKTIDTVDSL